MSAASPNPDDATWRPVDGIRPPGAEAEAPDAETPDADAETLEAVAETPDTDADADAETPEAETLEAVAETPENTAESEVPGQDANPEPPAKPPLPFGVKVGGALLGVGLIAVAAWAGIALGGGPREPEPLWPLEAPQQVGDYIVGGVTESPVPSDEGRSILRADYADGTSRVVLLMSRPETDLTEYLTNAGIEDTAEAGEVAVCGTSVDTGLTVCARMVDETGILMVGLTEQDAATLAPLLNDFVNALRAGDSPE